MALHRNHVMSQDVMWQHKQYLLLKFCICPAVLCKPRQKLKKVGKQNQKEGLFALNLLRVIHSKEQLF